METLVRNVHDTHRRLAKVVALLVVAALFGGCPSDGPSPTSDASSGDVAGDAGPDATLTPQELFEMGELLYFTAGGAGCASCHGPTGLGDIGWGPPVVGLPRNLLTLALANSVEMAEIVLTDQEIDALVAYMAYLATL